MNRLEHTLSLRQLMAEGMAIISDLYEHNMLMGELVRSDRCSHLLRCLDVKMIKILKQYEQLKDYTNEATR